MKIETTTQLFKNLHEYNPEMAFEKNRLTTFCEWPYPDTAKCNASKMAEAGFYSPQSEENCLAGCFFCQKFMYFDKDDIPWKEHVDHSPQCSFVTLRKKEQDILIYEFIDLIRDSYKTYRNSMVKEYVSELKQSIDEYQTIVRNVKKDMKNGNY